MLSVCSWPMELFAMLRNQIGFRKKPEEENSRLRPINLKNVYLSLYARWQWHSNSFMFWGFSYPVVLFTALPYRYRTILVGVGNQRWRPLTGIGKRITQQCQRLCQCFEVQPLNDAIAGLATPSWRSLNWKYMYLNCYSATVPLSCWSPKTCG